MGKAHSPNFLQERCGLTQPAPEVPFFSKRKEPKIRQRGGILFGFFSGGAHPLGNFALRSSLPLTTPAAGGCQVLHLPLRAVECLCRVQPLPLQRGSKGVIPDPLRWRSRNQKVPCVLFVKLSSHKKVSAGAGRVDPQKRSCRNFPAKKQGFEKGILPFSYASWITVRIIGLRLVLL